MMEPDESGFEFVLHEPNVALSRENRSKIRRHAMRAVGAARTRRSGTTETKLYPLQRRPPRAMPMSGLELLAKDCGLGPLDLSALASVHFGTLYVASL
jgi:hypothetical protein